MKQTTYQLIHDDTTEQVSIAVSPVIDSVQDSSSFLVPGYYTAPSHYEDLVELAAEQGVGIFPIDIVGAPTIITEPFKKYEERDIIAAWASAAHHAIIQHEGETKKSVTALLGYSLGAAGAVLAALELPKVEKLVLIGPVGSSSLFERVLLWLYSHALTRVVGDLLFRAFFILQIYINIRQTKRDITDNIPALKRFEKNRAETKRKEDEGARSAGYAAGVAKLHFQLPTYLAALKERGVSIELILFEKDHYVSTPSLQKMADRLGIPTHQVPYGHNRLKNRPEDLVPTIIKALQ